MVESANEGERQKSLDEIDRTHEFLTTATGGFEKLLSVRRKIFSRLCPDRRPDRRHGR